MPADRSVAALPGRVIHIDRQGICLVDTGEGRLHPASIGGLMVGAMGAFVFALYLRGWLVERRRAAHPIADGVHEA